MTNPTSVPSISATVHLLTLDTAREAFPDLFEGDESEPYFNEMGADGNAHWVDYWPDQVVVVVSASGHLLLTSNASQWHMTQCGYQVS